MQKTTDSMKSLLVGGFLLKGVVPTYLADEKQRQFPEFFVKNVMYVFYNYFLILEVHIFSNPQEFCYGKILNNEGITVSRAEADFIISPSI